MTYLLYVLSIFLCIFQDLPLANQIGDYGRSISGIFAIVILLYLFIKNKKLYLNRLLKTLIFLLIFLLAFNIITLVGYIISGKNMMFLGENIFSKSIKIFMYYFSNVMYILSLYQIGKNLPEERMLKPFYYIYIFLFVFSIIEYLQLPSAFPFLHATRPDAYNRIRLLTNESSNSSTIILVFFTLALQYAKKYKTKLSTELLIVSLLFFIYTTTAKSLFLVLIIGTVLIVLFNKKVKIKYKVIITFLFFISVIFLSSGVLKYFDLAKSSSTTLYTRGYAYIVSLIISIKYPLGVSNTLYLTVFTSELQDKLEIANNLIRNFNSLEIKYILSSGTDKNISAYSGLLQYGLYWGLIGNLIFASSVIKSVKKAIKNNPILFFGFITVALSVLSTISLDNKYEIWAFMFVLMMYNEKGEVEEWKK
ncbi:MAG: hypothetical protein ACI4VT_02670 [Bacilli bacterium]